jgi:hypothetical protein
MIKSGWCFALRGQTRARGGGGINNVICESYAGHQCDALEHALRTSPDAIDDNNGRRDVKTRRLRHFTASALLSHHFYF